MLSLTLVNEVSLFFIQKITSFCVCNLAVNETREAMYMTLMGRHILTHLLVYGTLLSFLVLISQITFFFHFLMTYFR